MQTLGLLCATVMGVMVLGGCPHKTQPYCDVHPDDPSCADAGTQDGGHDAGSDAGPCGACAAPTPLCRTSDNTCVACLSDTDCADPTSRCEVTSGDCVACLDATDCVDPAMARCDTSTHACTTCTSNDDCTHLTGTGVCDTTSGACVECTDGDTSACGGDACKGDDTCSMYGTDRRQLLLPVDDNYFCRLSQAV